MTERIERRIEVAHHVEAMPAIDAALTELETLARENNSRAELDVRVYVEGRGLVDIQIYLCEPGRKPMCVRLMRGPFPPNYGSLVR